MFLDALTRSTSRVLHAGPKQINLLSELNEASSFFRWDFLFLFSLCPFLQRQIRALSYTEPFQEEHTFAGFLGPQDSSSFLSALGEEMNSSLFLRFSGMPFNPRLAKNGAILADVIGIFNIVQYQQTLNLSFSEHYRDIPRRFRQKLHFREKSVIFSQICYFFR